MNFLQKLSFIKTSSRVFSFESYDLEKLFLNPVIYKLLQNITNSDPIKVHAPSISMKSKPQISLLTNEQLEQLKLEKRGMTRQKLQMPPIKNLRKENIEILEHNEKLDKFLPAGNKMIFTDIGLKEVNRKRLIVVRESNGDLRTANWEERDRINGIYFPIKEKPPLPPPLFNDENLQNLLQVGKYEYVLDLNCIQFEPDSNNYIDICHKVYEHVNLHDDSLRGINNLSDTRHFGGLVLYLVAQNNSGNIAVNLLANERSEALKSFLELYCAVRPESEFARSYRDQSRHKSDQFDDILLFKETVPMSSSQKSRIELHVDNYRQIKQKLSLNG